MNQNLRAMPEITPDEFIAKWFASTLKERSAAQGQFCALSFMSNNRREV